MEESMDTLQLFAEEESNAQAEAAPASAAETEGQHLRNLGVPAEKVRRHLDRGPKGDRGPDGEAATAEPAPVTEEVPQQETAPRQEKAKKPSLAELLQDPDYRREMDTMMAQQTQAGRNAQAQMQQLAPALDVLARQYQMDPASMDYGALAQAISDNDPALEAEAEELAVELGTSQEAALRIVKQQREITRYQQQEQQSLEQRRIQEHLYGLAQQGEAMKELFPDFDLSTEMQNPAFARMTAPGVGIPVKDAYFAVHYEQLQQAQTAAAAQAAAQAATEKITNAVQAGSRRPVESGASTQGPSVTTFNYAGATKEQREAFKRNLRNRWSRGETVYPGGTR